MAIDKAELRKLAEAATKGPWKHEPEMREIWSPEQLKVVVTATGRYSENGKLGCDENNGTFIAAANPEAILALLDALDAAEERESAARELLESIATSDKSDVSRAYRDEARQWLAASGPTTLRDENKRLRERVANLEEIRAVAEHYRVNGWEPGQTCAADLHYESHFDEKDMWTAIECMRCHGFVKQAGPHEIPPPNVLEPAGFLALLAAVTKEYFISEISQDIRGRFFVELNNRTTLRGAGATIPAALARAAYEAIPEESRNGR